MCPGDVGAVDISWGFDAIDEDTPASYVSCCVVESMTEHSRDLSLRVKKNPRG